MVGKMVVLKGKMMVEKKVERMVERMEKMMAERKVVEMVEMMVDHNLMNTKRIIPCLDVDQGRVVKGVKFMAIS